FKLKLQQAGYGEHDGPKVRRDGEVLTARAVFDGRDGLRQNHVQVVARGTVFAVYAHTEPHTVRLFDHAISALNDDASFAGGSKMLRHDLEAVGVQARDVQRRVQSLAASSVTSKIVVGSPAAARPRPPRRAQFRSGQHGDRSAREVTREDMFEHGEGASERGQPRARVRAGRMHHQRTAERSRRWRTSGALERSQRTLERAQHAHQTHACADVIQGAPVPKTKAAVPENGR
ncbi:MAG: hypothetical protein KIT31_34835, partial [Deltaproteobacteria bacterium]|nr:hypothetical protein [Deltaproteobacteria bacterium]